jgi:hypothetical protein
MSITIFRYMPSFKGDANLLNGSCSNNRDVADMHGQYCIYHQNIMSIDITSIEVWKN